MTELQVYIMGWIAVALLASVLVMVVLVIIEAAREFYKSKR